MRSMLASTTRVRPCRGICFPSAACTSGISCCTCMPAAAEGIAADDRFVGRPFTCFVLAASDHESSRLRSAHTWRCKSTGFTSCSGPCSGGSGDASGTRGAAAPEVGRRCVPEVIDSFLYSACQAHARIQAALCMQHLDWEQQHAESAAHAV